MPHSQKQNCVIHAFQDGHCCTGECKYFSIKAKAITDKAKADLVRINSFAGLWFAVAGVMVLAGIGAASQHAYEVYRLQAIEEAR